MREGHRRHAEERRERRDENGAQALATSVHNRLAQRKTARPKEPDVVDEHDGVVDHDADEQDDADVRRHAERGP